MARSTQQRASGSQRTQRPNNKRQASRRSTTADDQEDVVMNGDEGGDPDGDAYDGGRGEDEDEDAADAIHRKGTALARLALFNEYKRTPLKRDEINKKVGTTNRNFKVVVEHAQNILKGTFGYHLVELPTVEAIRAELNEQEGQASSTKAKSSGQRLYILRNRLAPELVQAAVEIDPQFLQEEVVDRNDNQHKDLTNDFADSDEEEAYTRADGAILAWSKSDSLETIGMIYVILGLILINNRELSDIKLISYLRRLQITNASSFPVAGGKAISLDAFLDTFVAKRFLTKEKADAGNRPQKRSRGGDGDDRVPIVWKWGPRAHTEIGEKRTGAFLVDFMVTANVNANDDEEEDEERAAADIQQAKEKMMTVLEKTVGGKLYN